MSTSIQLLFLIVLCVVVGWVEVVAWNTRNTRSYPTHAWPGRGCKSWCLQRASTTTAHFSTKVDEVSINQPNSPVATVNKDEEVVRVMPLVNGFFSNVSVQNPFGTPLTSTIAAKAELLQLLQSNGMQLSTRLQQFAPFEHLRLEYLVDVLQQNYIPIQTIPFLNLVLQGNWRKEYSNVLLKPERFVNYLQYNITERISLSVGEGEDNVDKLQSSIAFHWTYDPPRLATATTDETHLDNTPYTGTLEVHSNMTYNSKGHQEYEIVEHILTPHNSVPDNVEQFLIDLQRSIPYESFDPNATTSEIIYADGDLRIQRIQGNKYFKVINIFTRCEDTRRIEHV